MKRKKYSYLLVFTLLFLIGMNGVSAIGYSYASCFYMNEDQSYKAELNITYNTRLTQYMDNGAYTDVNIRYFPGKGEVKDKEYVTNWVNWSNETSWHTGLSLWHHLQQNLYTFGFFYEEAGSDGANGNVQGCPNYLITSYGPVALGIKTYRVFATNDEAVVQEVEKIGRENDKGVVVATAKSVSGLEYNGYDDNYQDPTVDDKCEGDECEDTECDKIKSFLGDEGDDGKNYDPNRDGKPSIRYYLDNIMSYVRIIVPILIILLGTIDFAKAVLAGKEDEMRKSQSDFAKRIIIGVAIFFVPLLINIVLNIADTVWQSTSWTCDVSKEENK